MDSFMETYVTKNNNKNHLQKWNFWDYTYSYTLKLEWTIWLRLQMLTKGGGETQVEGGTTIKYEI
jgi:hypothetical protein